MYTPTLVVLDLVAMSRGVEGSRKPGVRLVDSMCLILG